MTAFPKGQPKPKVAGKPTPLTRREKVQIRDAVFRRDGGCLLAGHGRCFGGLTAHHVVKAGQGGAYSLANLRTLCAHHNDQLEADADLARVAVGLGLVVRRSA